MAGNGAAVSALKRWAAGWAPGKATPRQRAALLEGRPGVGKTTAAWALAHDMGWTVVEMNASEARNKAAIEQTAGRAALTNAFSDDGSFRVARAGGRTLILLDEADCLTGRATEERASAPAPPSLREFLRGRYQTVGALAAAWGLGATKGPPAFASWEEVPNTAGRGAWTRLKAAQADLSDWREAGRGHDSSDRGGLGAIAQLVRTTRQPLVLTVNDAQPLTRYSPIFRQGVARIRFEPATDEELRAFLRRVILGERLTVHASALEAIVRRSHGDLRAALNDLEAVGPLPAGPAQVAVLGARDEGADLAAFVGEALERARYFRSVEIRDRIDATPDDLLPWIEEGIPEAAIDPRRRHAAFEVLGRAELELMRARRYRHYGLWSYSTELMTGGVATALDRPTGAPRPYAGFPMFLAGMGRSRSARALRNGVLARVDPFFHLSARKGSDALLPFLFRVFDPARAGFDRPEARAIRAEVIRRGKLGADEVGYLLGIEPDAVKVRDEIERATGGPAEDADTEGAVAIPEPAPEPVPAAAVAREKAAPPPKPKTRQKQLGQF